MTTLTHATLEDLSAACLTAGLFATATEITKAARETSPHHFLCAFARIVHGNVHATPLQATRATPAGVRLEWRRDGRTYRLDLSARDPITRLFAPYAQPSAAA